MIDTGYLKLYRAFFEHPIWTTFSHSTERLALGMLAKANFRASIWWDGHSQIELPPGAFVTSIDKLSVFCRLSRQQIRDGLDSLRKVKFATYQPTHRYTIVTICNWERYQNTETSRNTVSTTKRTQSEHSRNTVGTLEEEGKNVRREEVNLPFTLSASNDNGSGTKKEPKPKKPRVHRIDDPGNPGWELWKYVGWCKLFSTDPKRDKSSGAKELFGRFVKTEDDLSWLAETHASSNRAGQYEPGFNVWLKAALEAHTMGMGSKVFAGLELNREESVESTDKRKRKAAELGCKACAGSGHVFVKQADGPIGMLNCYCIFVDGADATKQRALVETEMALSPTGATA